MAKNRERREESAKGAPHEAEERGTKPKRARHVRVGDTEQLIFTLDAATGAVISIEKVDREGKRHEVRRDETAALAEKGDLHEIEVALDEAFEAGISSVLEPTDQDEPQDETEEEMKLRRVLLTHIIGQNVRRRLQRRLVQRLALSQTLTH